MAGERGFGAILRRNGLRRPNPWGESRSDVIYGDTESVSDSSGQVLTQDGVELPLEDILELPSAYWDIVDDPTNFRLILVPLGAGGGGGAFAWQGAWDSVTLYVEADIVYHLGSSWRALASNTNSEPAEANTDWFYVAKAGTVGAAGPPGVDGVDGTNAYTALTAPFTQPITSSSTLAEVADSSWMGLGQALYVETGGYYKVMTKPDVTHAMLANLGYSENASPGSVVGGGSKVSPAGIRGLQGPAGTGGGGGEGAVRYATMCKFGI